MRIVGIVGLNLRNFNDYCRVRNMKRKDDYTYENDDGDQYICIKDHIQAVGRQFDEILDLDVLRMELVYRLRNPNNYKLWDWNLRKGD